MTRPYRTIVDPQQAAAAAADGALLFDCRFDLDDGEAGHRAYLAGHAAGARYLHLDRDLAGVSDGTNGQRPLPAPEALAEILRSHGLDRNSQVIAYDDVGGAYAARLWWMLRWIGHDAVALIDGGFKAWTDAGLPVESGEAPAVAVGDFTVVTPNAQPVVDTAEILADLGTGTLLVIDARGFPRFSGTGDAASDPGAGHIPGARNHPFRDNLDATGRFKSPEALRNALQSVLDGHRPEDVVLQCGSGVTACHNALALEIAGLPPARLYPGSWSAWSADPARPVERG